MSATTDPTSGTATSLNQLNAQVDTAGAEQETTTVTVARVPKAHGKAAVSATAIAQRTAALQAALRIVDQNLDSYDSCATALDAPPSRTSAAALDNATHRRYSAANHNHALMQSPSAPTPPPFSPVGPGGPAPVLASAGGSDGGGGRNAGQDALTVVDEATSAAAQPLLGNTWSLVCGPLPISATHRIAERPD